MLNDQATIDAVEFAFRHWSAPVAGTIRPGSEAHKDAFCRMLLDTHNPYKPAVLDWPVLADDARDRLTGLPIWNIAVQTEGKAKIRAQSYADLMTDPLLREAITLDGFEEGRHKEVLSKLVAAYGIALDPEPEYRRPKHPEWAWMTLGFSECIDSFFAFGLFAVAKQSEFFPPELVETFEPVIQEEARHILFFVNWAAWHYRNLRWWQKPWWWLRIVAVWVRLVRERIGIARGIGSDKNEQKHDNNFTVTGSKAIANVDLPIASLIDICLAENDRRMAGYDARLLRPMTIPRLVRFARLFMRAPRTAATAAA
ncbi:MAG: ferritin-like domain-containing protein [Alphaproteobacteria bacterium]|nr:ferritin-like domain-containing protein [Alphaproteobacteria bacterium]